MLSFVGDYDMAMYLYIFWQKQQEQVSKKIEQTYGHIEVEKQTELLTQNQGFIKSAEVDLDTINQKISYIICRTIKCKINMLP